QDYWIPGTDWDKSGATGGLGGGIIMGREEEGVLGFERRTFGCVLLQPPTCYGRVKRAVQRIEPAAAPWLISDGRNDKQVARARGRHIRQAHTLRSIALDFERLCLEQIERRPSSELQCTEPLPPIDAPAG